MILRNRSLLALLAAELVSRAGSQMTFLALPWFVLVTTGSPAKMGIVLAVELLPTALLGVPRERSPRGSGAADHAGSDLARVPLMASLPIPHSAGLLFASLAARPRRRSRLLQTRPTSRRSG
jgi:hypothetical protein